MTAVIKLKRGTSTPSTSDITSGEVAVDTSAAKLYINDAGTVKEIGGGGGVTSDSDENTIAGTNAGDSITSGSGKYSTAFGFDAGTAITTGDNCTAIGHSALKANTTSSGITAVGRDACLNTTGLNNTAVGYSALGFSHTSGQYNVALGAHAIWFTNPSSSVAVGSNAARGGSWSSDSHSGTVAIGKSSLYKITSGSNNVSIGREAGYKITTGNENVITGSYAGFELTTGARNILIGKNAGDNLTTGENNIVIASEYDASAADVDNEVTIGNSSITKFRIPGLGFELDTDSNSGFILDFGSVA